MLKEKFKLDRRLGIGATAEVYLGYTQETQQARALKIFTPLVMSDPDTVRRIETEVAALGRLSHPNIVRLFQIHSAPDELALELEYIDGGDLREWRSQYKLPLQEPLLWILVQIARGLSCAHENGILHRDLKPENILISRSGQVKLSDFGLARHLDSVTMTKSGLLTGSIGYMAPETLDGQRPDQRSDLFSIGAVAYELLTGKNPFWGPNPQSAMKNLLSGKWQPISELTAGVPANVTKIIEQCLSLHSEDRPESIWHIEAELMMALGQGHLKSVYEPLLKWDLQGEEIAKAFSVKLEALKQKRELLKKLKSSSEPFIQLARDWTFSFPDAQEPMEILQSLPRAKPRRNYLLPLSILLFLAFATTGFFLWNKKQGSLNTNLVLRDEVVTQQASIAPPPVVQPAISVTQPTPEKKTADKPVSRKPTPPRGWIRVEADNDVQIYVDDQWIPPDMWEHIPASPGNRRLKLVKAGFMPIENPIEVRANQTAVVKAKAGN